MHVREAVAADHAAVLALNNTAVPHVNALSAEEFAWLARHANFFRVVEDAEGLLGFTIVLPSGLDYWSDNYKWFAARFDRFLYLDRVVVDERGRGRGAGRALYEALFAFGAGSWTRVALEVNLRPPNPGSEAFHARLGFTALGVREYDDGDHAVLMLERALA
ncbi:MAG: GNAT family N-acetyltransferase [Gemmatimonadaceae bacterium]